MSLNSASSSGAISNVMAMQYGAPVIAFEVAIKVMSRFNEIHVDHTMGGSMSCMNHRLRLVTLAIAVLAAPATLLAQEYPVKPIRVDNRSGANGNIGTDAAAKAPGDGYTMLLVASTFTMNPAVYPHLPFDTEKDFAPVTTILWQPYLLSVHPALPVKSVKELIGLARTR